MVRVNLTVFLMLCCIGRAGDTILLTKREKAVGAACLAAANNNATQIGIQNCQQEQYIGTVFIGTGGQSFTLLFDSGSNILWIPVTGCQGSCGSKLFNPAASPTYNQGSQNMSIAYGDNASVSGYFGTDVVRFANTTINVTTGILWVSQEYQPDTFQANGLVGLGFTTTPNFFDSAYAAGQISSPVFAIQLQASALNSLLYFNGLPTEVVSSSIFVPQYLTGHWQVQLIGFNVNGVDMTGYSASYAIVDSGTSLFFLNQYLYDQITNQYFQGCNIYSSSIQCPCSMTSSFPNFTFYFQGAKTYIYNTNYTIGCSAMFGPISDLGGILLGDTFMRNYIVTFDKGNSQVGFKGELGIIYLVGQQGTEYFYIGEIVMTALAGILFVASVVLCITLYRNRRQGIARPNNGYLIQM